MKKYRSKFSTPNIMTYNPSILDLRYLKLIPQNAMMTFRNYVYYLGPNATTNIWATTANGWVLWYAFLTTTIVWDLLQTYASIKTPTINPISGTLTIGNEAAGTNIEIATQTGRTSVLHLGDGPNATGDIHIGNGLGSTNHVNILYAADNGSSGTINLGSATGTTNLRCPLTPIRTYPVTPFIPTAGTVNYGTAGTIGYTIVASQNNGSLTASGINPASPNDYRVAGYFTGTTISVPTGVWILELEFLTNVIYGVSIGLSFGTTPIPAGQPNAITTKKAGMFGCQYPARNNSGNPNDGILSFNQTLCQYSNTTGSNVPIYGFLIVNGYGYGGVRATMTAVKIA
jgi:hypothetical protein